MNETKLQRLIDETADLLNLNEAGKKYLDVIVNMVYTMGQFNENKEIRSFQEAWEEVRQK